MAITSYVDDNSRLGKSFLSRDYTTLGQEIQQEKDRYTFAVEDGKSVVAFDISKNQSLSNIYKDDFFVVRFVLKDVNTFHDKKQEEIFKKVLAELNAYMEAYPGYYNLRMPTHIVDAIRAYNEVMKQEIFCGGTVEWIGSGKTWELMPQDGISVFWADKEYIKANKERLLEISYRSFKMYQGQYHISNVTDEKAGVIYEEWLQNSLTDYEDNVVVVTYEDEAIAFVLCGETQDAMEAVVGAVDSAYRQYGAYRLMISYVINEATKKEKAFVTSTQFDNFIVQGVWASLGLKPFYSIYNIHLDRRRKK